MVIFHGLPWVTMVEIQGNASLTMAKPWFYHGCLCFFMVNIHITCMVDKVEALMDKMIRSHIFRDPNLHDLCHFEYFLA